MDIVFLTLEQAEEFLFLLYMKCNNRFRFKLVSLFFLHIILSLLKVEQVSDLIDYVWRSARSLAHDPYRPKNDPMRFCKAKKPSEVKGTVHVKEWFSFLCQFPGVSESKAEAIILHYKSFAALMQAYNRCRSETERKSLLENIKVGERRLGPKVSSDIFQVIFGTAR